MWLIEVTAHPLLSGAAREGFADILASLGRAVTPKGQGGEWAARPREELV